MLEKGVSSDLRWFTSSQSNVLRIKHTRKKKKKKRDYCLWIEAGAQRADACFSTQNVIPGKQAVTSLAHVNEHSSQDLSPPQIEPPLTSIWISLHVPLGPPCMGLSSAKPLEQGCARHISPLWPRGSWLPFSFTLSTPGSETLLLPMQNAWTSLW